MKFKFSIAFIFTFSLFANVNLHEIEESVRVGSSNPTTLYSAVIHLQDTVPSNRVTRLRWQIAQHLRAIDPADRVTTMIRARIIADLLTLTNMDHHAIVLEHMPILFERPDYNNVEQTYLQRILDGLQTNLMTEQGRQNTTIQRIQTLMRVGAYRRALQPNNLDPLAANLWTEALRIAEIIGTPEAYAAYFAYFETNRHPIERTFLALFQQQHTLILANQMNNLHNITDLNEIRPVIRMLYLQYRLQLILGTLNERELRAQLAAILRRLGNAMNVNDENLPEATLITGMQARQEQHDQTATELGMDLRRRFPAHILGAAITGSLY